MPASLPADWLVPDWPAPAGVRACCSTRAGGTSAAPWNSLNLGDHVGDDLQAVAANRAAYARALGVRPVFLQQVHGTGVLALEAHTPDGAQADACWTRERGLACTMMVADCLPVLLCDAKGSQVAAAHAGWRGLALGVLESALAAFEAKPGGNQGAGVMAWLGPCITQAAFEVGQDVKLAFEQVDPSGAAFFVPAGPGKWMADLPGLARWRLARAGVTQVHGNDGGASWCTVRQPHRFFSHRRDGRSGRMAASIWLD